ncbi:MAG: PorT family protein [Ferruginibacter sp.]|nr:PorT family protein [Ferruginibacter sp.]
MKKLTTVLLVSLLATITTKAQTYVQAGLNLANITSTNNGQTQDNKWLPTFNVGIMSRFGISKTFDLESGLLFTGKGAKAEATSGSDYVKVKFNPLYIELPLNAVVKIPLTANAKQNIFFHAGPYVAVGVAGKSTTDVSLAGVTSHTSSAIKFNNDDPTTSQQEGAAYDRLKRFDYGINLGGGFDFGKLLLRANYGFGLAKINSTQTNNSSNDKNKFRTFSISVGIPL